MDAQQQAPDAAAHEQVALRHVDVDGVVCTVGEWGELRDAFSQSADSIDAATRRAGTDDPAVRAEARTWRAAANAVTAHGKALALRMAGRPLSLTPPAAADLPAGLLEDAVEGATALDVQNRSRAAQNMLAHALTNVVRRGWLAHQPDESTRVLRELADAVDEYLLGHAGEFTSGAEFTEARRVARQRLAEIAKKAWEVVGPFDAPSTRVVVPQPEGVADADFDGHPAAIGVFTLRYDSATRSTRCAHCEGLWPCDAALSRHSCATNPLCHDGVCSFRVDWSHNRPDMEVNV